MQIPLVQNAVVDIMLEKLERVESHPDHGLYKDVFEKPSPGRATQQLVIDFLVWRGYKDSRYYLQKKEFYPQDMLLGLVVGVNNKLSKPLCTARHAH